MADGIATKTQALTRDQIADVFDDRAEQLLALVQLALGDALALFKGKHKPLIICGGGVRYSGANAALQAFAERFDIPFAETQAGKSSLPWDHALNLGAVGVTGSPAANALAVDTRFLVAAAAAMTNGPLMQ